MKVDLGIFLLVLSFTACREAPEGRDAPPRVEARPFESAPPSDASYYLESRELWVEGRIDAWAIRRDEILATRGRAGQEFLLIFLAVAEQDSAVPEDRRRRAEEELARVLAWLAASGDKRGLDRFAEILETARHDASLGAERIAEFERSLAAAREVSSR
ncbi:MAG: hypothetical protein HY720_01745 [Planctomycetes bacterium]|nr:hypothetical protein [Planctomycetota bacterium]